MAKGGKQPGAGRPKGSTNKIRFADFVSAKDHATFVEFILSTYMGDMRLATWVGDQLFGKATQAVELGGPDGTAITVQISEAVAKKNGIK
jgi:hypothetical protein